MHIDDPILGDFYDGKSARRTRASITVVGDVVVVAVEGESREYPLAIVKIKAQLRGTPRRLEFPDGAVAVTDEHTKVEAAFAVASSRTLAHRLESNLSFVFAAMGGVIVAFVLGYLYGVPWAAREIALRLPIGLESQIAEAGMKSLDQAAFEPSELDADTKKRLADAFIEIRKASGLPPEVRLEFRDGGWIGANALALPGGVVVITDQLVKAMPGIDESIAVLSHELGHVRFRHSMRHLLQDSITALAAAAVYGDVATLSSLAVTAPTVLMHNGYSRDFEREADAFAFELLKKTGRSPKAFATAMRTLESAHGEKRKENKLRKKLGLPDVKPSPPDKSDSSDTPGRDEVSYLSTHPATAERIRAAEAAAEAP